jgi:FMN phosphatase YigB (HAD superfamily)
MQILTDVDGVLLNWEGPFHEWMRLKGHIPKAKSSYHIFECYPQLDKKIVNDLVLTFNASAWMGYLPPIEDAVHWVREMHEKHGVVLTCITSMGDDPLARKLRIMNLERVFGNVIHDVIILGCGACKAKVLQEYRGSNMIWLEDNIKNANAGVDANLETYLFNRQYNQKTYTRPEAFTRVDNWRQLYTKLFG